MGVSKSFFVAFLFTCFVGHCCGQISGKEVRIPGDFLLGALFPIHYSENRFCTSKINEQDGIQILEAAVFALGEVNRYLKPSNLSLGLLARDSCYETSIALQHALEFAERRYNSQPISFENCTCTSSRSSNVIGVIGPPRSKETVDVAKLLTLFKVPQISYFATTPELSDSIRYKYFKRTVPSDTFQTKALVSILSSLDWKYVNIIYEDSNYGINGYTEIRAGAENAGICFGLDEKVKETDNEDKLRILVDDLMKRNNTNGKVVAILFMQYALAYRIMELVHDNYHGNDVIWVGGDAWIGREPPSGYEHVIKGAIGISPETEVYPGFAQYFKTLRVDSNPNPWFGEYLIQRYNCSMTGKKSNCADVKINDFEELLTAYNVRNAVYAYGSAIQMIHSALCGKSRGVCNDMKSNLTGELVLEYLGKVADPFNTSFHFVNGMDGPVRYSVLQYEEETGYRWREKGKYNGESLKWNEKPIQERSVCSLPCKKGEFRSRSETSTCCWLCKACDFTDIVNVSDPYNCLPCGYGLIPNPAQNACVAIPIKYLTYTNSYVIVIIAFSSLGIVFCAIVSLIFVLKRSTPIVKATGFETSVVLLIGILLSYISPLILVSEPTLVSCGLFRLFLGLSYTMAYSSIFSKLIVYNRAFDVANSIKTKNIPGQTVLNRNTWTMKTALVMTLILSAIHLVAILIWIAIDRPTLVVSYSITPELAVGNRSCADLRNFSYFASLSWSFLLMIMCLVFAIKTRKLPEGMNDSHEIMYCSFTSFVLWIAFIPLYAISEIKVVKVMSLSMSLIIHGTVCLICLFITKIYIVVFRPEKNNKERVMRNTPSRSRVSCSGSIHGSHAGEKRGSFALTLEDKTPADRSKRHSSACVTDDDEDEAIDYSATSGTLPFQKSCVINKSEEVSEDTQIVLESLKRSSGEKLLGNKNDSEEIETTDTVTTSKVNGDVFQCNSQFGEEDSSPKHTVTGPFFKSMDFKSPSFIRRFTSNKKQTPHASTENIIDSENQDNKLENSVRRLSQSLPNFQTENT